MPWTSLRFVASIVAAVCALSLAALLPTGVNAATMTVTPSTTAIRMTVHPYRITDAQGLSYASARGFEGGWYHGDTLRGIDIRGTESDDVYRPEWLAMRAWRQPIANGYYDVTLKMREARLTAPNQRLFDVLAEGKPALTDIDIYQRVGQYAALDLTFRVQVTDGRLDLDFVSKKSVPVVSAIVVAAASTSGASPAPKAPAAAAAAGYTRPALSEDFTTLNTIDLTGNGDPTKVWFTDRPYAWGRTMPESLSTKDGVLTLAPTTDSPNYGIGTTSPKSGAGRGFKYGYFEARLAFDPADAEKSTGFPAFWGVSHRQITKADKARSSELDFFEATKAPNGPVGDLFAGTIHDWFTQPAVHDYGSYGNNWVALPSYDWNTFHTYGCLWQPGRVTWYLDGKQMLTQTYGAKVAPSPNPGNLPIGTFSDLDTDDTGQTVILGTGEGFPLRVDWVRVWQ